MDKMKFEINDIVSFENRIDKLALKIANIHHESQTDLSGEPYINHLIAVANMVRQNTTDLRIVAVAYLHDILEDTNIKEEDLLMDFPEDVVTAVKAITKEKGEPYFDYLERVKANEWATVVKIADLTHNSNISRIERKLTSRDLKRLEKYKKAVNFLTDGNEK